MACGVNDGLLEGNRKLAAYLQKKDFEVTYEEGPGAHEWDFWNRHIKRVIDWLPLVGEDGINSGNVTRR